MVKTCIQVDKLCYQFKSVNYTSCVPGGMKKNPKILRESPSFWSSNGQDSLYGKKEHALPFTSQWQQINNKDKVLLQANEQNNFYFPKYLYSFKIYSPLQLLGTPFYLKFNQTILDTDLLMIGIAIKQAISYPVSFFQQLYAFQNPNTFLDSNLDFIFK